MKTRRLPGLALLAPGLGVAALALPAGSQNVRPSAQVNANNPSNAGQVAVASRGDLSAACWNDTSSEEVFVSTSDGRGLTWSTPVRVDNDAFGKTTELDCVQVSGSNVYVVYESNQALSFTRSTDGGASFSPPVPLDTGPGTVADWAVSMSPDVAGDHLYVLSSTSIGNEDLFLTSSHDGGASFGAAVGVEATDTSGDVDEIDIGSNGTVVHVVWDDNRSGADTVYYQRSIDGGVTFLGVDVPMGNNVGVEDSQAPLRIAVAGNTLAVFWNEEETGSGNEVIQVNASTSAGASFSGARIVGNYPGTADTDEGDIAIDIATGNLIATWEDNRSGSDEAYAAFSADGGGSWSADTPLSSGGAEKPRIASGARSTTVTWEATTFPRSVESALTGDGGATWTGALIVSDNAPDTVDFVTLAHGDLYGNYVHAWTSLNGSDFNVYAGGFRHPTLTPVGWVPGPTNVGFDLGGFDPALPFGAVLLSSSPGSFPVPFGDGRNVGLLPDGLFFASLNLLTGPLGAAIGGDGSGSTPLSPLTLSPGTTLFAVGYQFGLPGGVLTVGELSDVTTISL